MNYKIITDEKALREFIDWLPELKEHERYYICLFARNKYCREITHIKTDKAQLYRAVVRKEHIYETIKKMEVELGSYQLKGFPIPQDALAVYITLNPRDLNKAALAMQVELAISNSKGKELNIYHESMSQIHKNRSRKIYTTFDIDSKDEDIEEEIKAIKLGLYNILGNLSVFKVLETRGGYHIIVDPKYVEPHKRNTWHKQILQFHGIDISRNKEGVIVENMMPIPGTYQGGFTPKFV